MLQIFMQIFLHVTNILCPVIADTQVHGVQYGIRSDPDVVFTLSRGDAVRPRRGDANINRQVWLKGGPLWASNAAWAQVTSRQSLGHPCRCDGQLRWQPRGCWQGAPQCDFSGSSAVEGGHAHTPPAVFANGFCSAFTHGSSLQNNSQMRSIFALTQKEAQGSETVIHFFIS